MICRSCNSTNLELILDLGETPWCNDFLTKEQIGKEQLYPLRLIYCMDCTLAQLDHTVPKETMFLNHTYVSGTTKTLAKHFYDLAKWNIEQFKIKPNDLIVDIGGNDGTQLVQYRLLGCKNLINVESAGNIAKLSISNGIPTVNNFFNEELVDKEFKGKKAKLINASGVFFHLEELHSVLRGIKKLLADDGTLVVQFMYLGDIVKNHAFDAIYHEHLCYYSLTSLVNLLKQYELYVFQAHPSPIHGGSMVAYVHHQPAPHDATEENCSLEDLRIFAKDVEDRRTDLAEVLAQLKHQGAKIYGYGAPAKSTTLLNYLGINKRLVDKLVEVNELKVGLYSPGTHIPIVAEDKNDIPDYYLLLAWNFRDEILAKNKGSKITFISPFPEIILHRTR